MKCVQDFDNFIYEEKNAVYKDIPTAFEKREDVIIKGTDFDLIIANLNRANNYFSLIWGELDKEDKTLRRKDPIYKDEYDRLNKVFRILNSYNKK